jgi:hypothetical protein
MPDDNFTDLMQAYLMARSMGDDPQMPDGTRVCCYIIAPLIREASGEAAEMWGNAPPQVEVVFRRRRRPPQGTRSACRLPLGLHVFA